MDQSSIEPHNQEEQSSNPLVPEVPGHKIEWIESYRKKMMLNLNGYIFHTNGSSKSGTTYWKCIHKKNGCPGYAHISDSNCVVKYIEHDHPIDNVERTKRVVKKRMRDEANNVPHEGPKRIYQKTMDAQDVKDAL